MYTAYTFICITMETEYLYSLIPGVLHVLSLGLYEPSTISVSDQGQTQIGRYKHRRWLEAGNFGIRKKSKCAIHVAKTKALISFAVTAKLICAFVFAYANSWFSHTKAHIQELYDGIQIHV